MSGGRPLRRGWTTGACATAATSAAYQALLTGEFPDPVTITLPGGQQPAFALAFERLEEGSATAGVVKDAGDDPDVTHGALVLATVRPGEVGSGVTFRAGEGVGVVTLPGLPLPVGEPAINPVPRQMMGEAVAQVSARHGGSGDVVVEVGVEGGEQLARRTWNSRLGIVGGISILGTTGIVIPYSCSAWIASIRRGIDVARAVGYPHVIAATGDTSERAAQARYGLPDTALLDMGDFAGALLKYLARHPLPKLTLAGGFAKLSKLAAGHLDLHSGRSQVDMERLAAAALQAGATASLAASIGEANTALHALELAAAEGVPLADEIAGGALGTALAVLASAPIAVEVLVVDRAGRIVGSAGAL
ncbi:cbiD: cobalamin biosynthesis protein CbiD [Gaiella occulta]|uniref:Cobalt-precorrin-5B C(1)-methyltransferase n=1 Tax=Gaiella occulta TaxID=1002870 RepID=A0A7M2YVU4_9ACTN|nr:cobalt-precorrin-5B (C(1))-methyltransferase [Gaiella occulta]RDI73587.1 cbiD: cobalamin biosynthesis protein CbiD [Gaiella occulta]